MLRFARPRKGYLINVVLDLEFPFLMLESTRISTFWMSWSGFDLPYFRVAVQDDESIFSLPLATPIVLRLAIVGRRLCLVSSIHPMAMPHGTCTRVQKPSSCRTSWTFFADTSVAFFPLPLLFSTPCLSLQRFSSYNLPFLDPKSTNFCIL